MARAARCGQASRPARRPHQAAAFPALSKGASAEWWQMRRMPFRCGRGRRCSCRRLVSGNRAMRLGGSLVLPGNGVVVLLRLGPFPPSDACGGGCLPGSGPSGDRGADSMTLYGMTL